MGDTAPPKPNTPATLDDVVAALAAQQTILAAILTVLKSPPEGPLPPRPATLARGSAT